MSNSSLNSFLNLRLALKLGDKGSVLSYTDLLYHSSVCNKNHLYSQFEKYWNPTKAEASFFLSAASRAGTL